MVCANKALENDLGRALLTMEVTNLRVFWQGGRDVVGAGNSHQGQVSNANCAVRQGRCLSLPLQQGLVYFRQQHSHVGHAQCGS